MSEQEMYVYSGTCLLCPCGEDAGFIDMAGKSLRTGDIVIVFSVHEDNGCCDYFPDHLAVVVSDQYTTYAPGRDGSAREHIPKEESPAYYVMGIKGVDPNNTGRWRVLRVKAYEDVIDGEHWRAYGFRFSSSWR